MTENPPSSFDSVQWVRSSVSKGAIRSFPSLCLKHAGKVSLNDPVAPGLHAFKARLYMVKERREMTLNAVVEAAQ